MSMPKQKRTPLDCGVLHSTYARRATVDAIATIFQKGESTLLRLDA